MAEVQPQNRGRRAKTVSFNGSATCNAAAAALGAADDTAAADALIADADAIIADADVNAIIATVILLLMLPLLNAAFGVAAAQVEFSTLFHLL